MPHISGCFTVFLYFLFYLETSQCYTYQTEPLFLSFADLAALEATSLDETNKPNSPPGDHRVKTFAVKCHEDSVEVVMKAHLFDPGRPVDPRHLRLGQVGSTQHHCTAKVSVTGDYIITARLTDCGGKVTFTQNAMLYNNLLVYLPLPTSPGDVFQGAAAIPLQCEYGRRYTVSSGALKPTWTPLISIQSTHLDLDFNLRLMADDWTSERKSSVYFLGDLVNIEASVTPLPLRLYVDSCVATLTSDVNSYPRYPFIDHHGCFTDSKLNGSSSRFLPRVQDKLLQIQLQPFLFHHDHRHTMYITCYLEAEPISNKDPEKRACSFMSGRWRSADGDDRACESCANTKSNHKRAPRGKTKRRQTELTRETSVDPVIFLTTVGKRPKYTRQGLVPPIRGQHIVPSS